MANVTMDPSQRSLVSTWRFSQILQKRIFGKPKLV
jgi:hypothetical protein